jgi:hypothetical protein
MREIEYIQVFTSVVFQSPGQTSNEVYVEYLEKEKVQSSQRTAATNAGQITNP